MTEIFQIVPYWRLQARLAKHLGFLSTNQCIYSFNATSENIAEVSTTLKTELKMKMQCFWFNFVYTTGICTISIATPTYPCFGKYVRVHGKSHVFVSQSDYLTPFSSLH